MAASIKNGVQLVYSSRNDFIGFSRETEKGDFIIACKSRRIIIQNVDEQKLKKEWSLKSSMYLCSRAVLDTRTNLYSALFSDMVLRKWSLEDTAIEKSRKENLPKEGLQLFSWPDHQPLLLYKDGTVALFDNVKQVLGERIGQGSHIIWCEQCLLQDKPVICFITAQENNTYTLCMYNLGISDDLVVQKCPLQLNQQLCWPLAAGKFSLQTRGSQLFLLILCEDGEILRTSMLEKKTESLGKVQGCGEHTAILTLDSTYIALANIIHPTEKGTGIGIWDSKFQMMKAWKPLPDGAEKSSVKMFRTGNKLLVGCSEGLYAYQFSIRKSTLQAALGKLATHSKQESQEWPSNGLKELLDPSQTSTYASFQKHFAVFCEWCWQMTPEKTVLLTQSLPDLVHRCTSETFWPQQELQYLIDHRMVPTSMMQEVIDALVSHGCLSLIHSCLTHSDDIPETVIASCLQCFLRTSDEEFSKSGVMIDIDNDRDVQCPLSPVKAAYINMLLCFKYNDVFLLEAVAKLDFALVLIFLKYLLYLLNTTSNGSDDGEHSGFPSLYQVADWIGIVLDGHYAQIALSTEAHEILLDLYQNVENKLEFHNELISLEALLVHIKQRAALPSKTHSGYYSIHTLHIH